VDASSTIEVSDLVALDGMWTIFNGTQYGHTYDRGMCTLELDGDILTASTPRKSVTITNAVVEDLGGGHFALYRTEHGARVRAIELLNLRLQTEAQEVARQQELAVRVPERRQASLLQLQSALAGSGIEARLPDDIYGGVLELLLPDGTKLRLGASEDDDTYDPDTPLLVATVTRPGNEMSTQTVF
jgi:hypothetical protein